jgi:hypothetical protein
MGLQMMHYDNPASRLYNLLVAARELDDNISTRIAWTKLLGEQESADAAVILQGFGRVLLLCAETRKTIEGLPKDADPEATLSHFKDVEALFFSLNLDKPWSGFKGQISSLMLYSLQMCSKEITRAGMDLKVSQEELDKLLKEVQKLIQHIAASKLDPRFSEFLLKHLGLIEYAILHYRISGVDELVEALERAVGAIILQPDAQAAIKKTEEGKTFLKILADTSTILKTAMDFGRCVRYLIQVIPVLRDSHWAQALLTHDTPEASSPHGHPH